MLSLILHKIDLHFLTEGDGDPVPAVGGGGHNDEEDSVQDEESRAQPQVRPVEIMGGRIWTLTLSQVRP